jgi:protein-disulfide isomerase
LFWQRSRAARSAPFHSHRFGPAAGSCRAPSGFSASSSGAGAGSAHFSHAIQKTAVDGVSRVVVYVGEKTGKQKPGALAFFSLPDGKHIIAGDDIIPFGDHPYADYRAKLQQSADGPYRGSASKDLELVEFADFQCPHCKEAQANMDKLATDFPKARIVFQNYPLAATLSSNMLRRFLTGRTDWLLPMVLL